MTPAESFRAEAAKRILIKDGAYGTLIQQRRLQSADYCGGLDLLKDQRGNNDLLNITRPDVVRAICESFADTCGASIPQWLNGLFEGLDDLPAARQLIAATVAAELCGQLYAGGVRHFHFYTLNRAELSYAICHLLGVRPQRETAP